jgi:hypothetical protein
MTKYFLFKTFLLCYKNTTEKKFLGVLSAMMTCLRMAPDVFLEMLQLNNDVESETTSISPAYSASNLNS